MKIMARQPRRNHSPAFKAKVAVAAIKGEIGGGPWLQCILIDLAARMQSRRDIGFLFVGRGSDTKRLKARTEALGLDNVLFHDEIDPDEIPDLYAQCHAGIVALDPRHKSHNIPGKFLTYLQNRLPVLANVNAGNDLAALVRGKNVGEVCETNQLDELEGRCEALVHQIEIDPDLPERCSRLFQRQFSVKQTVRQIVSALTKPNP